MGLIYKHTFKTSNKSYIGLTINSLEDRLKGHIKAANNGSELHFHRAIRKYGADDIISEILEININKNSLPEKEIEYIKLYNTFIEGYNMTLGGEGNLGLVHSLKSKTLISEKNSGYKLVIEITTDEILKIKVDSFDPNLHKNFMDGKIAVYSIEFDEQIIISKEFFNDNRDKFKTSFEDKVIIIKDGIRTSVSKEEFKTKNFESIHHNKSTFKDKAGITYHIDKDSSLIGELGLVGINSGLGNYIDEKGNKIRITTDEAKSRKLKGIAVGTFHKACAKNIKIYDNNDILKFECFGNFIKTCEENNLPSKVLAVSYKNDGLRIYEDIVHGSTISRLKNKGYWDKKGWYAIID